MFERVIGPRARNALGDAQKMQVMIAEDHCSPVAETHHIAQYSKRCRTAVDQITDKPQTVGGPVERACGEQGFQFRHAALHIADRIGGHEMRKTTAKRVQNAGSRRRYWIASAIWAAAIFSVRARSAMLRDTRRMR